MMNRTPDRRTILMAAGVTVVAGSVIAQSGDIQGVARFADSKRIPKGHLRIHLENMAMPDQATRRMAETSMQSDGFSTTIRFSLPAVRLEARLQVIARLERADGWLLARGSAQVRVGRLVDITLHTAMY